jgi:hypothetical protein
LRSQACRHATYLKMWMLAHEETQNIQFLHASLWHQQAKRKLFAVNFNAPLHETNLSH